MQCSLVADFDLVKVGLLDGIGSRLGSYFMQQRSYSDICPEDHGKKANVYDSVVAKLKVCFGYGQIQNELYLPSLASGKVLNADFGTHRCDGSQRSFQTIIRASSQVRWSSLPSTEEMLTQRCFGVGALGEIGVINY